MNFMIQAFGEFHKVHIKMTMSVVFCLSYDPLKWDFITFKLNIISIRKCYIEMVIVSDDSYARQNVITYVVIQFL